MEDNELPKSYGEGTPSPISFPEEEELCRRLDDLYQSSGIQLKMRPSSFFRGALFALRYKDNPDWMAQVAHSLREILYQFQNWSNFENIGSTYNEKRIRQDLGTYYNFISDIAHHRAESVENSPLIGGSMASPVNITPSIFEDVVLRFGKILFAVLRRQIEVHREIDEFLNQIP